MPPVQFLAPEISVRTELNALSNVSAELSQKQDKYDSDSVGVDIGGGETLWGDGSITSETVLGTVAMPGTYVLKMNSSYIKHANGNCDILMQMFVENTVSASATISEVVEIPYPIELLSRNSGNVGSLSISYNETFAGTANTETPLTNSITGSIGANVISVTEMNSRMPIHFIGNVWKNRMYATFTITGKWK